MATSQNTASLSKHRAYAIDSRPTFDDIESDVGHLHHLIQVTLEQFQNLPFTREDGTRHVEFDEVHSLLWVARDMAEKLVSDFDAAQVDRDRRAAA